MKVSGYRILIDPKNIDDKYEGTSLDLVKAEMTKDSEKRNIEQGLVLQVGPDAYKPGDCREPWCKEGDTVLFKGASAYNYYDEDDKLLIIINEENILAVL